MPSGITLADLHHVIRVAMGWTDSYLREFRIGDVVYTDPDTKPEIEGLDENDVTIDEIAAREGLILRYNYYDFGDLWEHEVRVERILDLQNRKPPHPTCFAGERACPPEGVGNSYMYGAFLEALRDPKHRDHKKYDDWIGGSFDGETVNLDQINHDLRRIRLS